MASAAPGRSHRTGITLPELFALFPTEDAARDWFEAHRWPHDRYCPRCGSLDTTHTPTNTLPYWCPACRRRFSVTSGTALERTRMPLQKWAIAIYLFVTNLKGVSSMKLHRDLGITQKSAWYVLHRLRLAFDTDGPELLPGPVEVDETYMGGKRRNMSKAKRATLTGRGSVGKTAVVGMRDRPSRQIRAQVVPNTRRPTLHRFVADHAAPSATVYTDEHAAYRTMPFHHEAVTHSAGEYVRGQAHTNSMESFWATFKRAHKGTYHQMSPKHLQRYVDEFAGRNNIRDHDTLDQMTDVVAGLIGKRLLYRDLIADS